MRYLVIMLTLVSGLICGCKSAQYRDGYVQGAAEARAEIASNSPSVYRYGTHPVTLPKDLRDTKTGLPIKFIAGCIVSEADIGRAEGHNRTIVEQLKKDAP